MQYDSTWGIGFELPFTINVGVYGVVYKGKWIYQKSSGILFCFMENVKNLKVIEKGSSDLCWTNGGESSSSSSSSFSLRQGFLNWRAHPKLWACSFSTWHTGEVMKQVPLKKSIASYIVLLCIKLTNGHIKSYFYSFRTQCGIKS